MKHHILFHFLIKVFILFMFIEDSFSQINELDSTWKPYSLNLINFEAKFNSKLNDEDDFQWFNFFELKHFPESYGSLCQKRIKVPQNHYASNSFCGLSPVMADMKFSVTMDVKVIPFKDDIKLIIFLMNNGQSTFSIDRTLSLSLAIRCFDIKGNILEKHRLMAKSSSNSQRFIDLVPGEGFIKEISLISGWTENDFQEVISPIFIEEIFEYTNTISPKNLRLINKILVFTTLTDTSKYKRIFFNKMDISEKHFSFFEGKENVISLSKNSLRRKVDK